MIKCAGCGAILQNVDPLKEGYTLYLENKFCERCFRITHYNDYILSDKNNSEYYKKIDEINKTHDLVVLTLDFLNLFDIDSLKISNPVIVVLTKKDLLPRSVNESKFLNKIKCNLNVKAKMFVSSKNNYNLDLLMDEIKKHKVSSNVYVIGLTNAGKSTLINKILKNYSNNDSNITTSNLPSTTLDYLEKEVNNELTLIDTPGLLDEGSMVMEVSREVLKKIIPKKEINPIIYQIKNNQTILIEDFLRLDVPSDNIITLYMSNNLNINRIYKSNDRLSNLNIHEIRIDENCDLVIKGLGFIKFKNASNVKLYLADNIKFFVRKSMV